MVNEILEDIRLGKGQDACLSCEVQVVGLNSILTRDPMSSNPTGILTSTLDLPSLSSRYSHSMVLGGFELTS